MAQQQADFASPGRVEIYRAGRELRPAAVIAVEKARPELAVADGRSDSGT